MFRVLMNNNVMDTCRTYSQALNKAKKIKALFCKKGTFDVFVESANGLVIEKV